MERLFVAAWPDASTVGVLGDLPRPDEAGVRWVPPERWHLTLRFLGDTERDLVVARLADAVLPRSDAMLGPAIEWLGRQLVVPVAGVDDLAATVVATTDDLGEPPRHRFRGHLTIARTTRHASSSMHGHPISAGFSVDEIALVQSELTPDGPRYTTVATFPTA